MPSQRTPTRRRLPERRQSPVPGPEVANDRRARAVDQGDRSAGESVTDLAKLVASRVVDVPDFPLPGIMFKDLSPLFADGGTFRQVIDGIVDFHGGEKFDVVVGVEA